jgi:hypothetical protein
MITLLLCLAYAIAGIVALALFVRAQGFPLAGDEVDAPEAVIMFGAMLFWPVLAAFAALIWFMRELVRVVNK